MTLRLATSMTETSFDTPLVVEQVLLVGREGHVPDPLADQQIVLHLVGRGVDHGDAVGGAERHEGGLAVAGDADADRLDGLVAQPGDLEGDLLFTSCFDGSMTLTVPPISEETQTSEPSGLNSAKRGRASTSTLATIWRVCVSMKCAMLVVSDVLTRILPSGLMPHAFRLDADLDLAERRAARSR